MNKIVNGVANDFEFETLTISNSNANIRQLFEEKDKEIERLNNIINELEKWLNDNENPVIHYDYESKYDYIYVDNILDKLKKLKEGK